MNVLVINQYASCPLYSSGAGERHYYIAKELSKKNVYTTIIASSSNHLLKKKPNTNKRNCLKENYDEVDFIWVKGKNYSSTSSFGRFYSWLEFLLRLFFIIDIPKPDIVVVSSMSIFPIIFAILLKFKYRCKLVLEIRDIWPLTLIELGSFKPYNPAILLFRMVEKLAYRRANFIVSVLPGFKDYFSDNFSFSKEIEWIPNGIDINLNKFTENERKISKFKVIYAGALGTANQMQIFLEAAKKLAEYKNIIFEIIGDGPEKENLVSYAKVNNLRNINFIAKVSKKEVAEYINKADLCFIAWKKCKLYSYGISPNKLNDYMLAKKPIISSSGLKHDPVRVANCGLVVEAEDHLAIAESILKLSRLPSTELKALGENGYQYILNNQSYKVISEMYYKIYKKLSGS